MSISGKPDQISRRSFVQKTVGTIAGAIVLGSSGSNAEASPAQSGRFLDIHRAPDIARVYTEHGDVLLTSDQSGRFSAPGIELITDVTNSGVNVVLSANGLGVSRLHLRWNTTTLMPQSTRILGDTWERAYGDLAWRGVEPGRIMPWYFIATDSRHSQCYGVMTGPAALCFWMIDDDGISLWADVRSGSTPVQLGSRQLDVATVVTRSSRPNESPFDTLHAFCKQMCPTPRLADHPIYGHNDWDFFYGHQTAATTLAIANTVVGLSPSGSNRPYIVIDDGWEGTTDYAVTRGPWDHGNPKFPDMPGIASSIKSIGGRPGIWIRPTSTWDALPDQWRLARDHSILDPTVPEAKQQMTDDITRLRSWGFELLKPDFLTVDIMGKFGMDMGADLTDDGWTFKEGPIRTTAEVVLDLYNVIRAAAGPMVVIGCNTFSHLAAGIFEAARIGDDTSGNNWERTRKMGVNCLGFRSAQNRAFYAIDPDIAPITKGLPWEKSKQWLSLVAQSGSVLFTSIDSSVMGQEQTSALRDAFTIAANSASMPIGAPLDWMDNSNPRQWMVNGHVAHFDWVLADGTTPFNV